MKEALDDFRKAFWHFRKGGIEQLRRWNNKRIAESLELNKKSLPLAASGTYQQGSSLVESWKNFTRYEQTLQSAAATRRYRNPFAQGWVLVQKAQPVPDQIPDDWVSLSFGNWVFHHDPNLETNHCFLPGSDSGVLLLGHAADSGRKIRDSAKLAPELLKAVIHSPDWESFDAIVSWLGGRFIAVGQRGSSLRIHVDAMASRSCYWGSKEANVVLASHSALVAHTLGNPSAADSRWALTHPDYNNPTGKCLPGMITPHDGVKLVIANCALMINDNNVRHERFFSTPPEKLGVAEATDRYLAELRFQMEAALSSRSRSTLALTAGADSRAILTATLDLLQEAGTSAMTYHFFARNADHSRKDLLGANRLANASNLNHRILDVPGWDSKSPFAKMYHTTFPAWARFPSLAQTYYENLGADESLIIGIGGEVGTVFYREREFDQITPEVLAGKYTQSAFRHDPRLIESMAEYMEYTQLSEENSAGYELLDLFYWEHRLSTWAAYGYSEADFGPQVVLPLNSRRLIHAMLSLPFKDRLRRSIYHELSKRSGITG